MDDVIRVTRGVWRPASHVAELAGRCAALLGCAPAGSVVAGHAAARLHGLWLPGPGPERVELIVRRDAPVPRAHSHSVRAELRTRRRHVHADEIVLLDGLPVTSPGRTWLDLAESLGLSDLVAVGDSALRAGETSGALCELLARAAHRPGVRRARAAFALLNERSRSRPESVLRVGLVTAGLPVPEVNRPIHDRLGQWLAEPDLAYRDVRLAIEYNGVAHADPARMRRDISREIDLLDRGDWYTLVLGPAEVFRSMDRTVQLVRELRRRRGA